MAPPSEGQGGPPQKCRKTEGDGAGPSRATAGSESEAERLEEFVRWTAGFTGAATCGLLFQRCDFGIGAFAGRELLPGETVLQVPFSLCITAKSVACEPWFAARIGAGLKALDHPRYSQLPSLIGSLGPLIMPIRVRIWLYLIHARLDNRSPHHVYVRLCPAEYDDPLWWSEEELAELCGSNLLAAARSEQRMIARLFDVHVKPLTTACPEMFPPHVFSLPGLLWARSLWASRAFPRFLAGADCPTKSKGFVGDSAPGALLPGIDSFNHKRGANMEWLIGRAGTGVSLRMPSDTPRTAAVGEQLWINYGPKSDEEWLFNHGFLLDNNSEHNRVELVLLCEGPLKHLRQAARLAKSLDSAAVVHHEAGRRDEAALRVGPFLLEDVGAVPGAGVRQQLPEALVTVVSFLVAALHGQGAHAGPGSWLAEALERQCASLQTPATARLSGTSRPARRQACARAYMASQRMILTNAAGYLRALSEREAAELFALPSSCAPGEAGEHLVAEGRRPLRVVFAEDDAADAGHGGDEDEQASEEDSSDDGDDDDDDDDGDDDATGASSSKAETGSDNDADGALPPQDLDNARRNSDAPESVPNASGDGEVLDTTVSDKVEKNFVLFGDGCAIRVAFETI
ncbi:unnamed protein product [Prorocentrum cordatum]|uniref:SET domain-containing protein n=1 Tax=Prorocentrum cordatum TaxID=2364126 RepID=A0ABN9VDG9_9DINO|nr:unnamed protein product [Polarella glacialis]